MLEMKMIHTHTRGTILNSNADLARLLGRATNDRSHAKTDIGAWRSFSSSPKPVKSIPTWKMEINWSLPPPNTYMFICFVHTTCTMRDSSSDIGWWSWWQHLPRPILSTMSSSWCYHSMLDCLRSYGNVHFLSVNKWTPYTRNYSN